MMNPACVSALGNALANIVGAIAASATLQCIASGTCILPARPTPSTCEPGLGDSLTKAFSRWRPFVLPTRPDTPECDAEWAEEIAWCTAELAKPNPNRRLMGGFENPLDCVRGRVSFECGGNPY